MFKILLCVSADLNVTSRAIIHCNLGLRTKANLKVTRHTVSNIFITRQSRRKASDTDTVRLNVYYRVTLHYKYIKFKKVLIKRNYSDVITSSSVTVVFVLDQH